MNEKQFIYKLIKRIGVYIGPEYTQKNIYQLESDELTGSSLLTNMQACDAPVLRKAAQNTGFNIYIENEAFSCYGKKIPNTIGVYSCDIYKDHSDFWNEFNKLKKTF